MSIEGEVRRIAKLAKLDFTDGKLKDFTSQFQSILNLTESLKGINCDHIEPLKSPNQLHLRLRVDKIEDGNLQDEIFQNAPGDQSSLAKDVKCFVVPKVIE